MCGLRKVTLLKDKILTYLIDLLDGAAAEISILSYMHVCA